MSPHFIHIMFCNVIFNDYCQNKTNNDPDQAVNPRTHKLSFKKPTTTTARMVIAGLSEKERCNSNLRRNKNDNQVNTKTFVRQILVFMNGCHNKNQQQTRKESISMGFLFDSRRNILFKMLFFYSRLNFKYFFNIALLLVSGMSDKSVFV